MNVRMFFSPCDGMHRAQTRPRFILSSERFFWKWGQNPCLLQGKKIPSTGSSEEDRNHDAASRRTASQTHYRLSYTGPVVKPEKVPLPVDCEKPNTNEVRGAIGKLKNVKVPSPDNTPAEAVTASLDIPTEIYSRAEIWEDEENWK